MGNRKHKRIYRKCYKCGRKFPLSKERPKDNLYCLRCQDQKKIDRKKMLYTLEHDDEIVRNLVVMIIQQACRDYVSAVKRWHKAYTDDDKRIAFDEVCSLGYWFYDEMPNYCLALDPKTMRMELNRVVAEKVYHR